MNQRTSYTKQPSTRLLNNNSYQSSGNPMSHKSDTKISHQPGFMTRKISTKVYQQANSASCPEEKRRDPIFLNIEGQANKKRSSTTKLQTSISNTSIERELSALSKKLAPNN